MNRVFLRFLITLALLPSILSCRKVVEKGADEMSHIVVDPVIRSVEDGQKRLMDQQRANQLEADRRAGKLGTPWDPRKEKFPPGFQPSNPDAWKK